MRLAYGAFKDINDMAKNKKTMIIKELIESTQSSQFKAFYRWANLTTYSRMTEENLKRMKLIKGVIHLTQLKAKQRYLLLINTMVDYCEWSQ